MFLNEFLDFVFFSLFEMTTNKRTASLLMNDDTEMKKLKTEIEPTSTTSKESISSFVDEKFTHKQICQYGEACYRQKNPKHTAEYNHSRK